MGGERLGAARRRLPLFAGVAALFVALSFAVAPAASADAGVTADAAPPAPTAVRQRELLELLHQDCGSCHGMRLTGGLGPPLTAVALEERPFASVVATIQSGRPGTPMPPWRRFLSDDEAEWLAARLVRGTADAR
jgi:cytochrome c55X